MPPFEPALRTITPVSHTPRLCCPQGYPASLHAASSRPRAVKTGDACGQPTGTYQPGGTPAAQHYTVQQVRGGSSHCHVHVSWPACLLACWLAGAVRQQFPCDCSSQGARRLCAVSSGMAGWLCRLVSDVSSSDSRCSPLVVAAARLCTRAVCR